MNTTHENKTGEEKPVLCHPNETAAAIQSSCKQHFEQPSKEQRPPAMNCLGSLVWPGIWGEGQSPPHQPLPGLPRRKDITSSWESWAGTSKAGSLMKPRCLSNKLISSTDIWEIEKGFEGGLTFISLYTSGKTVGFVKYSFHRIWKQNVTAAGNKRVSSLLTKTAEFWNHGKI